MKYQVRFYEDSDHEVIELETNERVFKGSLADSNAWLQLNDKGYL